MVQLNLAHFLRHRRCLCVSVPIWSARLLGLFGRKLFILYISNWFMLAIFLGKPCAFFVFHDLDETIDSNVFHRSNFIRVPSLYGCYYCHTNRNLWSVWNIAKCPSIRIRAEDRLKVNLSFNALETLFRHISTVAMSYLWSIRFQCCSELNEVQPNFDWTLFHTNGFLLPILYSHRPEYWKLYFSQSFNFKQIFRWFRKQFIFDEIPSNQIQLALKAFSSILIHQKKYYLFNESFIPLTSFTVSFFLMK